MNERRRTVEDDLKDAFDIPHNVNLDVDLFERKNRSDAVKVSNENFMKKIRKRDEEIWTNRGAGKIFENVATSPGVKNSENMFRFVNLCRSSHVHHTSSSSKREKSKESSPSQHFDRRSASRGRLSNVKLETVSNGGSVQSTPLVSRRTFSTGRDYSEPSTNFAGNPMFDQRYETPALITSHTRSSIDSRLSREKTGSTTPSFTRPKPPSYDSLPLAARISQPSNVPQDTMVRELLGALHGMDGSYFRKDDARKQMRISATCSLDKCIESSILSILEICNSYLELSCASSLKPNHIIGEAFLDGIMTACNNYMSAMDFMKCDRIQEVCFGVQPWRHSLSLLRKVLPLWKESPMDLLDKLYIALYTSCNDIVLAQVWEQCLSLFCRSIHEWLLYGTIMCQQEMMIGKNANGEYVLKRIPLFLDKECAQYILKIGKTWSMRGLEDSSVFDNIKQTVETQITPKVLYRTECHRKLKCIVSDLSSLVCGRIVDQLRRKDHLINHFSAARSFLLCEDTQFAMALYDKFREYTIGFGRTISQNEASRSLLWAVSQSSIVRSMPFPVKLETETSLDDSPNTSSRLQFIQPLSPQYLTNGIVSIVFRGTKEKYCSIFQFIWSIDIARLSTVDAIAQISTLGSTARSLIRSNFIRPILRLYNSVHMETLRVLQSIRHFTLEVSRFLYNRLIYGVENAKDIDNILERHNEYLDRILHAFFLDTLNDEVSSLISNILHNANEVIRLTHEFCKQVEEEAQNKRLADKVDYANMTKNELREFEELEERMRKGENYERTISNHIPTLKVCRKKLQMMKSKLVSELSNIEKSDIPCISGLVLSLG